MGNEGNDSIESRIESGAYSTFESLIHDVDVASSTFLDGLLSTTEHVNGERSTMAEVESKARSQSLIIKQSIDKILRGEIARGSAIREEDEKDTIEGTSGLIDSDTGHERGLVLTLNSVTEKGPKPLYSGLQHSNELDMTSDSVRGIIAGTFASLDAKILPNGMTVIEPVALHTLRQLKESKEKRTIGEVFPPHRSLKSLEAPQLSRNLQRDGVLEFGERPGVGALEKAKPIFKGDYKFAPLPTGHWLQYHSSATKNQIEPEEKRRQRGQTLNSGEGLADLSREDTLEHDQVKVKALFQAAYSSFAPSIDNSAAVMPENARSELWWNKFGKRRFQSIFSSIQYPLDGLDDRLDGMAQESPLRDDFETVVTDFEPEEHTLAEYLEAERVGEAGQKGTDELLTEVSELLETLNSYQRIRNLSSTPKSLPAEIPKAPTTAATPSTAEFDTYEILKLQLTVLIDSLPPFAIAKLNGDHLSALNIGSKMLVENYDYSGTMEPDDQTLQRRRAAAIASAAASRTAVAPAGRTGPYHTPAAPASNYNRAAYTVNSARPPYQQPPRPYATANTPTQPFQTPRPPSSTAQRPSYGYSQTTNVQQFQRPMQNGYGSYTATPSQAPYGQRPTQPGYQQRAQDNAQTFGRSASPQKPVVNGQQPYYAAQAPRPAASTYGVNEQQAAIDRAKLVQQHQLQKPSSGTPQTAAYGYDGSTERRETPNGAPVAAGIA